ncbi:MAG: hypothetical protein EZS28_013225 [Streblomastix strix]|uniref:Reverse transcriptase domain-containing protein n=1 Tax=Streblomastix strix TaxID=222440 RepID=A0A5J4W8J2_9EUKA|nr:MAG: hypothetical protein EZS28_013225 [Streblomastix strix]
MPLGISITPGMFEKTIQIPIDTVISKSPVRIVNYEDDILFLMQDQQQLEKEIECILEEFRKYGLLINVSKSKMKQKQQFVFLGWMINSTTMKIQLTNEKRKELKSLDQRQIKLIMEQKTTKDQKRSKFGWQAQVFHSIIQTRRTASIVNKQFNEQGGESNMLDKRNDNNEEVFDRAVLVDEPVGESKAKAKYHLRKAIDSILQIEEENGWTLTIRHIAAKQNNKADKQSRLSMSEEYSKKSEVLEDVLKDWQAEITVDLFAARNSAKCKRYYSLGKDKKAEGRDSMIVSQEEEFAQIHPPIPIISRVIRKIIEEKAQGIMIVPCWTGQVWWTQLKEISVREKELCESEKVLQMRSKMRKRNLKDPPGRILALEVNGDMMGQECFEMLWKHPDYQEMKFKIQQITGMEVEEDTPVRYQPFGCI